MKPTNDKTTQRLKDKFDQLGEVETQSNKKEVREARRRIKRAIHKRERNIAKKQLRDTLEGKADDQD